MTSIVVVGDGPGGLSAALFLAKAGLDVTVFGTDQTAMHYAFLHNYLGAPDIAGSDFQRLARLQVESFGAVLRDEEVVGIDVADTGFTVSTASETLHSDHLILTEGKNPVLALSLGVETTADGISVDREYRSSIEGVYVLGRAARPKRSQAIISAGAGAVAAVDILSREHGKDFQDWDTP